MPSVSRQVINKRRWPCHLLILSFLLYLVIRLSFLESYPFVDWGGDESWYIDYSITFLITGELKGSIFSLTPLNEPGLFNAYIYNGLLSLLFKLFGPGLIIGRLLSLMAGLFVIYLTYLIGKELSSPLTGSLSALFLSSSIFFGASLQVRPEALFTALFCASILFFIKFLKTERPFYLFLSGLISASSIWVHPNAIVSCLGLSMAYLILYRRVFSRASLYLLSGFFTILGPFFFINYLPLIDRGPSTFRTVHLHYMPPLLKGDLKAYGKVVIGALSGDLFIHFFRGHSRIYMNSIPLYLFFLSGLFIFTMALFLARRGPEKKVLLIPVVLCLCLYLSSVLLSLKICQQVYLTYFMPLLAIAISSSLLKIKGFLDDRIKRRPFMEVFLLSVLIVSIADQVLTGLKFRQYNKEYKRMLQEVSSSIPEGSSVVGGNMYYQVFIKRDIKFHSYLFMQNACPSFPQTLRVLKAGYVIWDNIFEYLSSLWCYERYKEKVKGFLEKEGEIIMKTRIRYPFILRGEPEMIDMEVVVYKVGLGI